MRALGETELLERLRDGDSGAATEFYDRYADRVCRFIMQTLGGDASAHDAEDLMQETFISLAEALPYFRGESSLFTFACAIAHRKTLSFIRTKARRARISASFADPPTRTNAPDSRDERLAEAMASLAPDYREVLHLKYVEDATTAEIASILRESEHAVESRLARARRAIRKLMETHR